ncbi:MAG: tRNA (adenosine(37)-N6)-threonylcarbamoyltransferase complex transferase subunit TsaD [Coriobacteriia bacterium]|jgi:N6-L-threonylcarbamoyladenine synthase|nr:tRNA (adenosine(37)-N6)-threonylcarbamoyltransferase complex transferase subunit TsaD [Coriobacteriia bacterium]
MTFALRPLGADDLQAVLEIEVASFPDPWSPAMFISELSRADRIWLAACTEAGVLVGYGGVMIVGDEAHLMNLAVAAAAQGCGVATMLLEELSARAARAGARRLTLEVRNDNASAQAFYQAKGLSVEGVRRGYYGNGADALIMWTDLGHAERSLPPPGAEVVLAIETSCDETAAAVMRGGTEVLSSVIASQVDFHARFGGVVPEIASRKHTEAIVGVVTEALERASTTLGHIDAIAVTQGPGLIGALVVGLAYAKGLAFAAGLPLVGVNHLEGHIFANLLSHPDLEPPLVALVVSGGHTSLVHVPEWGVYEILGETLDDATGEAFDKVAKVLGLGYPGGPILSRLAAEGDRAAIEFPRAMMRSGDYRFSLSGLKTAVINHIRHEREAGREIDLPDLAASFQAAVVDVQVAKTLRAAKEYGVRTVCLAGGVAANPSLRESLRVALAAEGIALCVPELSLCTDNAAMIAAAGTWRLRRGDLIGLDAEAVADLALG